jgi:hypothetical protein
MEDEIIIDFAQRNGGKAWGGITEILPSRSAKQCRERWNNHLNPTINTEGWSGDEDRFILNFVKIYGTKWSQLAELIPSRTDNAIKNRWYGSISKRIDEGSNGLRPTSRKKSKKRKSEVRETVEADISYPTEDDFDGEPDVFDDFSIG